MRNMCLGITAFVVTVGMVSVGAQGRNFSGTWIIDSEKTQAAAQAAMVEAAAGAVRSGGGGGAGGRVSATGGTITAAGGGVPVVAEARSAGGGGGGGRARGTGSGEVTAAGVGGGGGGAVAVGGLATAVARTGGGGRGGGGAGVPVDMVITMDGSTFTLSQGEFQQSYPTNGTETTVQTRGSTAAKATASWKGDMLVIEQTIDSPNGPVTSTTSWFLEGDSLVRLTTRRTYFKRK